MFNRHHKSASTSNIESHSPKTSAKACELITLNWFRRLSLTGNHEIIDTVGLYGNNVIPGRCPFANIRNKIEDGYASILSYRSECSFHAHTGVKPNNVENAAFPNFGGTMRGSQASQRLLKEAGGGDTIRELCTRFYAYAMEDFTLNLFLFETDGAEDHGKRLADWIIEKMGGEGKPWTQSGRHGTRQQAHRSAWYNSKRPKEERGRRFKLHDCRVWMRLHFMAARDVGLHKNTELWTWYIGFIAHFIAVYERSAPPYAQRDAEWSSVAKNIQKYEKDGRKMKDVIGRLRW